jgi:hypothetical protein
MVVMLHVRLEIRRHWAQINPRAAAAYFILSAESAGVK